MVTLNEIKKHNKSVGQYFFDRGNAPVLKQKGDYLLTKTQDGKGFIIYKYDSKTGNIRFVDNPSGEYSWQPYKTRQEAMDYINKL